MTHPHTPVKTGKGLDQIIYSINLKYDLQLPNPIIYSPSTYEKEKKENPLDVRCFQGIKRLYWDRSVNVQNVIGNFEEWVKPRQTQWVHKPKQDPGTLPSRNEFLKKDSSEQITHAERDARLKHLIKLIDDEIYLSNRGSYSASALEPNPVPRDLSNGPLRGGNNESFQVPQPAFTKQKSSEDKEVFVTAPSSPMASPAFPNSSLAGHDEFDDSDLDDWEIDAMSTTDDSVEDAQKPASPKKTNKRQSTLNEFMNKAKPIANPIPDNAVASLSNDEPDVSFSTATTSGIFGPGRSHLLDTSFGTDVTDVTDPVDYGSTQESSVVGMMVSGELNDLLSAAEEGKMSSPRATQCGSPYEQKFIEDLLQNGPFAAGQSFRCSIPLRYRYELERITREWQIPYDQMLVGDRISFSSYEGFWEWITGRTQRHGNALPEKSATRAWDSAIGQFKDMSKDSEVTVLTGDLNWCDRSEPGILKLKLNPLRVERSCRLHRRFGSDRFLSLTIPAPSCPPEHLRFTSHPSLLRESIVKWLTHSDHMCLGRKWRPFYVEEVKRKRKRKQKDEIRFRIEFFAIDGEDFDHSERQAPPVAPVDQGSHQHTPMSVESLLEWHMPRIPNIEQSDCKLFQRLALGLSKTWATVVLHPEEILHLEDIHGKPVMNDGCALMSRALAREICDQLGIPGNTPSCFQGRIAGAKGLWMVDRHNSSISAGDRDFWIQISDSQLKIKPHPHYWTSGLFDKEQLTFEVANWSKPLHSVDLNIQLLNILEHRGKVKEYIAGLVRDGIEELYQDFAAVMAKDSAILCRILIQKIRPPAEEGLSRNRFRRLDRWILDESETIIRFLEAGFTPLNFFPLFKRLRNCLKSTLDRYFEELHIRVPLSTYAFCIADPYGVLGEDEVHFGFSSQWQDPSFEDNMLDGIDVLVGRLPAHLPSDIQRRRAVWKQELRHFKDVIVFPTRGDIPLAHMLSGGDYDGDTPWICWDQNIVKSFRSTNLPQDPPGTEYFGLKKHSTPMREIESTDEFLEKTFMFNLTLSNLGRCTLEHEKIVYEESLNSDKAKELATLLSHLVDSRKAGLQLSEDAWKQYGKKISPRTRKLPAYKNPEQCQWRPSNIIDFLKFGVAKKEVDRVLGELEKLCEELEVRRGPDKDLLHPWQAVAERALEEKKAGREELDQALVAIKTLVEESYTKWIRGYHPDKKSPFEIITQAAADVVREIQSPAGEHPLLHTWQNSEYEWRRVLASCAYAKYHRSEFVYYAVGEMLCQIKTGHAPARLVRDVLYSCYKVSTKMSQRLAAKGDEEDNEEEYEGQEAIEELLGRGESIAFEYDDDDDGASVE